MQKINRYNADSEFVKLDMSKQPVEGIEFDSCSFSYCNFAEVDISKAEFLDCEFENCDFSNAIILGTAFKNVKFRNCKLVGLQFTDCNPFLLEFNFDSCHMLYNSFFKLNIPKTQFVDCKIIQVDFSDSNLNMSRFVRCDLQSSIFDNTNLQKVDFSSSFNFSINPEHNKIQKAVFSRDSLQGLLCHTGIIIE